MWTQSKGWIVSAVLTMVTTLPVCVLAQDTTVPNTESDGRQRKSRNNGRVVRDSDGIPHITASTEREAIYLQGFTHAQDRLFQMDVSRRTADGTLAELLGAGALASDVQLRTFGLRRAAERSLPILSQGMRNALSVYADGVNDYVARNPLPAEYTALEITTFRNWTPVDSLVIVKLIAFGLSFELTDLDRTTRLAQYQAEGAAQGFNGAALFFEDVNRLAPFDNAATVPDATRSRSGSSSALDNPVENPAPAGNRIESLTTASPAMNNPVLMRLASDYLEQLRSIPFLQSALKHPDDDRGSNEFVISGKRSRTGLPILANDPHLQLTAPSIFYENEIRTPGFSAIGASFAGAPFVIVGNNERFAWGVTTHFMDVTDVYQERIVPDPNSPSGLSTMYQGNLEPVQALPQTFRANTLGDGVQNNVVTVPPGGAIPAAVLIVPRRNQGPSSRSTKPRGPPSACSTQASAAPASCRPSAASIAPVTSISSSRRSRASTSGRRTSSTPTRRATSPTSPPARCRCVRISRTAPRLDCRRSSAERSTFRPRVAPSRSRYRICREFLPMAACSLLISATIRSTATIPTASCSPVARRGAMWPASSPMASSRCRACLAVKAASPVVRSTSTCYAAG